MEKPQYGILRFAKYKGPEISRIEAHNERTKEVYASNPDVDLSRSHLNFHLVEPKGRYRAESNRQIARANCRVRSDSVRMVEAMVTASPEFFQGKSRKQVRAFFQEALAFLSDRQDPETILSAVVHLDEKTPHMHLCFVPITGDGRLSAKEIVGSRKTLTQWQDAFWERMVKKFPELERGESASVTGRDHIPPRVFKEMTRLTEQKQKLEALLTGITPLNAKSRAREIGALLDRYIPGVEKMDTQMKKYRSVLSGVRQEAKALRAENQDLSQSLTEAQGESALKKMRDLKLQKDYADALALLDRIPPEVLQEYQDNFRETGKNPQYKQEEAYGK